MRDDVLIVEISGKRPGTSKQRTTEKYPMKCKHIIVSNDSEGYETDWEIVNVPEDYKKWYIENVKTSDKAWYAPMNRSYAIKYAREHGYKYLVQMDDNIKLLQIAYLIDKGSYSKRYTHTWSASDNLTDYVVDDFVDMMCAVLDNTNAGMCGMNLAAVIPDDSVITERYVYSFFTLKLDSCPDVFQGDFEDDIEYRLKLAQMGIPCVQLGFLQYGKQGGGGGKDFKDLTGCRAAYKEAGVKRGEHMRKLYGDIYSAGTTSKGISTNQKSRQEGRFKHKLKTVKLGVKIKNADFINSKIKVLLEKYAVEKKDSISLKEKEEKK